MTTEQPKKVINRYSLRIALINMFIGIELFFMPFLLFLVKDFLPQSSVLRATGGGDIVLVIFPLSILITLVGLIMTIGALISRKAPVPKGAPLTTMNKTSLVFTTIFALINLRMTWMVIGWG